MYRRVLRVRGLGGHGRRMRDRDLYAKLLGIEAPWSVRDVDARLEAGEAEVRIGLAPKCRLACPECGVTCGKYDTRTRSWRHLDTMQYRTVLTADVPRVQCKEHGVKQVVVPWAEPGASTTCAQRRPRSSEP